MEQEEKIVVVGAGPVGSLAALYAASRGKEVEIYELRGGMLLSFYLSTLIVYQLQCFHSGGCEPSMYLTESSDERPWIGLSRKPCTNQMLPR